MQHRAYNMIWQLLISVDKFEVVGVNMIIFGAWDFSPSLH